MSSRRAPDAFSAERFALLRRKQARELVDRLGPDRARMEVAAQVAKESIQAMERALDRAAEVLSGLEYIDEYEKEKSCQE